MNKAPDRPQPDSSSSEQSDHESTAPSGSDDSQQGQQLRDEIASMAQHFLEAETRHQVEREQLLDALANSEPALLRERIAHDNTTAELTAAVQRLEIATALYEAVLRDADPTFDATRVAFEQTQYALQSTEQQLHALQNLHQQVVGSFSWRATKPLRVLDRIRKGNLNDVADGLWLQVRRYAEQLSPNQKTTREVSIYRLISVLDPLLRRSSGYRRWQAGYRSAERPKLQSDLIDLTQLPKEVAKVAFESHQHPVVSIVISAYGNLPMTLGAIKSIAAHQPSLPFEVIVAEDASGDTRMALLREIPGLIYIENASNLGFLRSTNAAAARARGEYLFLMNNDAELTPGAIDALVETFRRFPQTGLAGSKLIYPDGRLQEAGGIIWRDATGFNFGRLEDPNASPFNYVREVDYCSGAAIMLPRSLFASLGGFDEFFLPAYYEDTDLAFRVRQRGFKVMYQPHSTVVHHEGVSHGTDINVGIKAHQRSNQARFLQRWQEILLKEHYAPSQDFFHSAARSRDRTTVLVVDRFVPQPDRDAGSRSTMCFLEALLLLGCVVKFWPHDLESDPEYSSALEARGIEVLKGRSSNRSFDQWMTENHANIDMVLLSRPNVAVHYLATVRHHAIKLLFYGHDIHYLRLRDEFAQNPTNMSAQNSLRLFENLEPQLWKQVDVVYYPSSIETQMVADYLKQQHSETLVRTVPVYAFQSFPEVPRDLTKRSGLIFVASFTHTPNSDAALWLKREILPLILKALPDTHVLLIGANPGHEVRALADANLSVTGYVTDQQLEQHYQDARVAVAPLRFGGGMKGKVVESLRFGLPLVTTQAGVQGFDEWQGNIFCEDDPAAFAARVVALLRDDDLWQRHSLLAQDYARRAFSMKSLTDVLAVDVAASRSAL